MSALETGIRFYKSRMSGQAAGRGYAAEFLLLLSYICGVEGILYALDFVLFLDFRLKEAAAVTAAVCLIIWLMAVPGGRLRILTWPVAAAGCIWIYRYMDGLTEEIRLVCRMAGTDIWNLADKDLTKSVILFIIVCSLLLFLLTYKARMAWLFLIITIPMVFLGPLLGQKLDIKEICLFGIFHIGTWILGAGRRKRGEFTGGEFTGAFLILALFLLLMTAVQRAGNQGVDILLKTSSRVQEQIHQLSVRITGEEKSGGVNRGNQTPTGQSRLQVAVSQIPQEVLYLKNFTGSRYMGEFWEAADESVFWSEQNIQAPEGVSSFLRYADEKTAGLSVQVRDLTAGEEKLLPSGFSPSLELEREESYSDFAAGNYMDVPVANMPQLVQLCEDHPLEDYSGATDTILKLIQERMVYSRTPGQVPYGRDTLEYYMFEKGEGYCQHFASVAALMYRMYGVPSRYAAGYIVRPAEFEAADGGFQAVVTDENAHAWTEIYLPGRGWEVVEATPPGSVVASPLNPLENPDTLQGEEDSEEREVTPTPTEEVNSQQEEQEEKEGSGNERKGGAGKTAGMIVLSAVVLLFLFLLVRKILSARRVRMRKRYPRWRADRLYVQMMEVLHFGGLFTEYDGQEKEFPDLLCRQITSISQEEAEKGRQTALLAAYGKEGVSREQRGQVFEIYGKTCRYVLEHMKGFRKIYFLYGRAFW